MNSKNIYIAILRGINVSGKKLIKMQDLKNALVELNFGNIETYIQSGNIVFEFEELDSIELEKMINDKIMEVFGFDVPVIVLTIDKLQNIIEKNPLNNNEKYKEEFIHITFLATKPVKFDTQSIVSKKIESEDIYFTDEAVYLYCPTGYGQTKMNNNLIESKLKVQATTRNWRTTNELLKISKSLL